MNCTHLQQFITTYPRKRNTMYWQKITTNCFSSWVSLDFLSIFWFCVNTEPKEEKKNIEKLKEENKNKGYVYNYRSWKHFSTRTTLVLANAPVSNAPHWREFSMLKMKYKKEYIKKTPHSSHYWHFQFVMLCTRAFRVTFYNKTDVKVAIMDWTERLETVPFSLSWVNMSVRLKIWGLSLAIHSRGDSSVSKVTSTWHLVHFMCCFTFDDSKHSTFL